MVRSISFSIAVAIGILLAVGCGSGKPKVERYETSGTVQIKGRPVKAARMVLVSKMESTVKAVCEVKDGKFAFSKENGPAAGRNQVQLFPLAKELEQVSQNKGGNVQGHDLFIAPIAAKYGSNSNATIEISAEKTESIKINLK